MWNKKRYHRLVHQGLTAAKQEATRKEFELNDLNLIIFSDLHRGVGDRADDFRRCQAIYQAALHYYNSLEFRLALLGDIEELWERNLQDILDRYRDCLSLEQQFAEANRYWRFVGNHDDQLKSDSNSGKKLYNLLEPYIHHQPLYHSLSLKIQHQHNLIGEIFLVHGHQGIRYRWYQKGLVRFLWAPLQSLTGLGTDVPSKDYNLRQEHEKAMYSWAEKQSPPLVLISGHTHHPVFMSVSPQALETQDAHLAKVQVDWVQKREGETSQNPVTESHSLPCYFNAGSCSFWDGDITGIEITGGRIQLVRWSAQSGLPKRELIRQESLLSLFEYLKNFR